MYELLGICLSLAGLLAINSFGSLLAAAFWRGASQASRWMSASMRAQFLFLLRIAPGLAAILCVAALLIPSYLAHEPRDTGEIVTLELGLLAALSLYGVGLAMWRGVAARLATRRLVEDWLKHAEPLHIRGVAIPAFRFQHPFPVLAIVGAVRPRLFIAEQILRSLSEEEIAAAVAHENGHLASGDNVKRGLLRACRDTLAFIPFGRSLDRSWTRAAEAAADEYAAGAGASMALNLASALLKVARLAPGGARPAMLAGASLITEDLGNITSRVLRLTQLASDPGCSRRAHAAGWGLALGICLSVVLMAAILTYSVANPLTAIHEGLEYFVAALQ